MTIVQSFQDLIQVVSNIIVCEFLIQLSEIFFPCVDMLHNLLLLTLMNIYELQGRESS